MRAMILTQQKCVDESPLAQQEMDAPRTGRGQVRVKVSVCAVCRTDIHIVEGDLALHKMPVIPDHQIVGRVDEIGDGVTRLRVGQRIGIAWLRQWTAPANSAGVDARICAATRAIPVMTTMADTRNMPSSLRTSLTSCPKA
jgi:D-arabinose 1-dehydrogenase-like Zn-dependent alcohol dehydrogenase